jgi:hypothetical protein
MAGKYSTTYVLNIVARSNGHAGAQSALHGRRVLGVMFAGAQTRERGAG